MPIALILFGDNSHTDLHGVLSVKPVSFTLSLINVASRNLLQFWRLLGYIPNLSAGKDEANGMSAKDKIQDEHNCLFFVLKSLQDIDERGGVQTHIKVWVHFIIGDTEGNNKWLGHYPGNNCEIMRPYRDCQCSFDDMCKTNLKCIYTTLEEMTEAQRLLCSNKDRGLAQYQAMSRYPIINALMQPGLALSDQVYGAYRMTPPELLHTSGAGLILYMFCVIADKLGAGLLRSELDTQHVCMMTSLRQQSECDFPRGATQNGIVDGTKNLVQDQYDEWMVHESEDLTKPPCRTDIAHWISVAKQQMKKSTLINAWMQHDLEYFPCARASVEVQVPPIINVPGTAENDVTNRISDIEDESVDGSTAVESGD
jgi:hypothetical protein